MSSHAALFLIKSEHLETDNMAHLGVFITLTNAVVVFVIKKWESHD